MSTLKITITDKLATVALDRGRSNAINHQMVVELTACIKSLENNPAIGGLIITGKEGFFSSGIDLIEVYDYDEQQIRAFWIDFLNLQSVLAGFKKPVVAAISGHSPAGGCILAICCDYRIMAAGEFIIGLNEVPVGIIVPGAVFNLYAFWLGRRKAYQFLLEGKLLKVSEALDYGLIDEVVSQQDLPGAAQKKIRTYMQLNHETWYQSKLNLRRELINSLNADPTETLNRMLEQWWAPDTRKGLELMIQNLKARSSAKK